MYSKIPILRPPLKLSKSGLKDHFWTVPKVVLKTTFGQSQRWSLIKFKLCVEYEEKNNFKVFNGQDVLILGGLNSGISLYFGKWLILLKLQLPVFAFLVRIVSCAFCIRITHIFLGPVNRFF